MNRIPISEPEWWMYILEMWMDLQEKSDLVYNLAPIFADIFVITYPIFLVALYIFAIVKKRNDLKQWAFYVFFCTLFAVLVNIFLQSFLLKERPIAILSQVDVEDTIFHEILPESSFPSDHAVVSMSFAIAVLIWWIYNKKKFFIWSGVWFILISLVMTCCRVLTFVHRPSDILAWLGLWIIIPLILFIKPIRKALFRFVIDPIIKLEKLIVKKIFNYEQ